MNRRKIRYRPRNGRMRRNPLKDRPIYWVPLLCGSLIAFAIYIYGEIKTASDLSTPEGFQFRCGKAESDQVANGLHVLTYGNITVTFAKTGPRFTRDGDRSTAPSILASLHCKSIE
jgi:hypothetical protein